MEARIPAYTNSIPNKLETKSLMKINILSFRTETKMEASAQFRAKQQAICLFESSLYAHAF